MRFCAFTSVLLANPFGVDALKTVAGRGECSQHTDPPTSCPQGQDRWSRDELIAALPDFAKVYAKRPLSVNVDGVNTNHAFALWFTTSRIQPSYIIESGVNMGQCTWLLRQAAPNASIFSLDPIEFDTVTYHDPDNRTRYFLGSNFTDISLMDWDALIPRTERSRTLVILDDHMSSMRRSQELQRFGFQHLWYDDNYKDNGDTYSFNTVCSPVVEPVIFADHFGKVKYELPLSDHARNVKKLNATIVAYFEFPAVFDGCPNNDRGTSLVKDEASLVAQGFPNITYDRNHYLHLYPPYVQLRPKYPWLFA